MKRLGLFLFVFLFCVSTQAQTITDKVKGMEKFPGFSLFTGTRRPERSGSRSTSGTASFSTSNRCPPASARTTSDSIAATRQQRDRAFRSQWTTRVARRAELPFSREQQ